MSAELMLDVGQANEFKLACRRAGYTNADIKKMCEGDILAQVLSIIRGHGEVTPIRHTIDCDANPFIPDGWRVEEHRRYGQFEWDPTKVSLHLSPNQQNGKVIEGNKLRRELASVPVLNANVLDYLLANQHLIPEEWKEKGKAVFFWGTIYRCLDGHLYVRYLCFNGRWRGYHFWLDRDWLGDDLAARLAA
ncbi:MAG: hypothetical protein AAB367_01085 [Patescibacteria group bacterium]